MILITGETGFVGTHLLKFLKKSDIAVVNNHYFYKQKNEDGIINNRIDILDKNSLEGLKENIDTIVHLASKTSIPNSHTNPYETYYTNIVGTLNILEFARKRGIKKIINVSTYVYGKPAYLPIDESHPVNPHSPYNKSKILAENLCENYSTDHGLNIVTLRPFYIYGSTSTKLSFIASIGDQINSDGIVRLSAKNTKRDFLFVGDFVELILKVINNFPTGYNVYNVGSGKSYSLEEIIKILEKIMNRKITIKYDDSIRPNDILEMVADISAVSSKFRWKPKVDIEVGLNYIFKNDGVH